MQLQKYDLSEFNQDEKAENPNLNYSNYDLSQFNNEKEKPNMVETWLGKMQSPESNPALKSGTKENKSFLEEVMASLAPSAQGMNMIENASIPLATKMKSLFTKITPRSWVENLRKGHDFLKQYASDIYGLVKDEVNRLGLNDIKLPKELIEKIRSHLGSTDEAKELIKKAESGDYEAIHKIQSELGNMGHEAKSSGTYLDTMKGKELLSTRDKLLDLTKKHFKDRGHDFLVKLMDEGRSKWHKFNDLYYGEYTPNKISQMVNPKYRLMPGNKAIQDVFSEESIPIAKILEEHPEIAKELATKNISDQFMKSLKKKAGIGTAFGVGSGALYGGSKILDYFNQENS